MYFKQNTKTNLTITSIKAADKIIAEIQRKRNILNHQYVNLNTEYLLTTHFEALLPN